ncbi:MAG TPA: pantoate--beta-alanine ligase [Chthoniobacterales bacterium]
MKIATAPAEIAKPTGKRVLVPTMGALHRAHGELMRVAREHAGPDGEVAVSIFVNPLQFEPGSDFERYPRPEAADDEFCRQAEVDLLFRPDLRDMYAADRSVFVDEVLLANTLEGKARPGHFRGVCTVVAKLFNILNPTAAIFGEKDFQQLAIIRRMVRDLNFKIEVVAVPTVREADGLAFSSRNQYLSEEERKQAAMIRRGLVKAAELAANGEKSANRIISAARDVIQTADLARIDYIELVEADTLQSIDSVRPTSIIAAAVSFGKTRLIDNVRLE